MADTPVPRRGVRGADRAAPGAHAPRWAGLCARAWHEWRSWKCALHLTNFEDLYGGETVVIVPGTGEVVLVTNAVMHGEPMHSGIPQVWPRVRAAAAYPARTVTSAAKRALQAVADHIRDPLVSVS